ncbi:lipopolysaccharide transport system ATP-binding protein [Acidovorax delafieldii]|uniref:Lipopolysaccharide transport system ATP-binding protein n=1 Tax=Acidovorax delafieldii TaxID=47920 RepID=A0A561XRX6_ACIDE|nr:ABC transporter ATP-binding protein [Acidovorax delafieldii]TWG38863.1 lipopolysaccharide transport system ATP-binding protein [Acidovorax delafieldii]
MGNLVVSNVGKAYKRYPSKWSRIVEWVTGKTRHEKTWVLRGISFSLQPGEAVGIVGENGAGKSTLLKIIAGTTQSTEGGVHVNGKVAALLELGMGFHSDFTGRQNIFMAGQLLGHTAEEISLVTPEIEKFADIGKYIDQPVRVYSSGMQVRLAFAVATAIRPDVLIVDEALSVGDASFQRKCFQRIEAFRAAGTTLLFVSHDIDAIKKICNRALFINQGTLVISGASKQVCDEYERYLFGDRKVGGENKREFQINLKSAIEASHFDQSLAVSCEIIYGNGQADIEACWLADTDGCRINVVESGIPFQWCYRVRFIEDVKNPIFAMMLKTREGVALYGTDSTLDELSDTDYKSGDVVQVCFSLKNQLAPGIYYLNCGVRIEGEHGAEFLSRRVDSALLRVTAGEGLTVVAGLMDMKAQLDVSSEVILRN